MQVIAGNGNLPHVLYFHTVIPQCYPGCLFPFRLGIGRNFQVVQHRIGVLGCCRFQPVGFPLVGVGIPDQVAILTHHHIIRLHRHTIAGKVAWDLVGFFLGLLLLGLLGLCLRNIRSRSYFLLFFLLLGSVFLPVFQGGFV